MSSTILGGYQPDTRLPSARRADYDLLRRITLLEKYGGGDGGGAGVTYTQVVAVPDDFWPPPYPQANVLYLHLAPGSTRTAIGPPTYTQVVPVADADWPPEPSTPGILYLRLEP